MTTDHKMRQKAFRIAFDYLEQQAVKVNGYANANEYFAQAWDELLRLSATVQTELAKDLLIRAYEELERIWQTSHAAA